MRQIAKFRLPSRDGGTNFAKMFRGLLLLPAVTIRPSQKSFQILYAPGHVAAVNQ
jgi:hypothetical protein